MHRLTTLLGMPQHRFASIHVVGTNGKSSVAQMTAALLEAHGVRAGAGLSPHASRWAERVRIRGEEISHGDFSASVARTAEAADIVKRSLPEGEEVTQFEVATAAAFVALAAARVEAGVIEAGLGGRLDATNVLPSRVTVLTSVGLDHTEWLGDTEAEIAAEKLAVLRDHSTLVVGRLSEEVSALADRTAAERGARLVRAPEDPGAGIPVRASGPFQRRNFSIACAAAGSFLGGLEPDRAREVGAELAIAGRLERIADDPPTLIDAAHNPDGAAALAEALPGISGGRPVVACVAILADKDAAAMLAALAPATDLIFCTEFSPEQLRASGRPGSRPWEAGELAAIGERAGVEAVAEPDPLAALDSARAEAIRRAGILIVAGSHYLLATARARLERPAVPERRKGG
jgi:dihydrofolate synthase / folylpolyglutamate synthase